MARTNTGSTANWLSAAYAPVTAAPLTLAGWINPANLTSDQNIIAINVGGSNYFSILFDGSNAYGLGDNTCVFDVSDAGGFSAIQSPALRTDEQNKWIHCAGVAASATSRIAYLNGRGGSTNTTSKTPAGVNKIDIGAYRDSNTATTFSPLNGSIGEVGVWNVALTPAEIALLANGANPRDVRGANLVAYWSLRGTSLVPVRGQLPLSINGTMGLTPVEPPVRPPRKITRDPVSAAASGIVSADLVATASISATFAGAGIALQSFSATAGVVPAWNGAGIIPQPFTATVSGAAAWNGAVIIPSAFTAAAGATASWNGALIELRSFTASAGANAAWNGASIALAAWAATAGSSAVWNGAGIVPSTIIPTATVLASWNGIDGNVPGTSFSATATAVASWDAVAIAPASFSMLAGATVSWNPAAIVPSALAVSSSAAAAWKGVDGATPTIVASDFSATALATAVFSGFDSFTPTIVIRGGDPSGSEVRRKRRKPVKTWKEQLEELFEEVPPAPIPAPVRQEVKAESRSVPQALLPVVPELPELAALRPDSDEDEFLLLLD